MQTLLAYKIPKDTELAASALPSHLHSRALHRLVQNLRQNSHSTGAQPNYLKSQKQAKDDYMKK